LNLQSQLTTNFPPKINPAKARQCRAPTPRIHFSLRPVTGKKRTRIVEEIKPEFLDYQTDSHLTEICRGTELPCLQFVWPHSRKQESTPVTSHQSPVTNYRDQ
jgi:hypothetical protein